MANNIQTPPTAVGEANFTTSQTLFNINSSNVSKLTYTNYLMWSLQVHALLDGYDLAGYLDGSIIIPHATVTANEIIFVNPAFTIWKRQDKLIYSALLGAISSPVQPLVSRATTSSQIWHIIASTYVKPSRGHTKKLKNQLKQWTKGNKFFDEYLQGLITRMDQLVILGKALDHENQIELILEGLPDEYKSVVDQIEGKDTLPTITEVHERLLNHEAKILSKAPVVSSPFPVSANVVQQRNQPTNNNNNRYSHQYRPRHNNNSSSNYQPPQYNTRPETRVSKPYLGKCQFCNVQGHSAKRCPKLQSLQSSNTTLQHNPFTPWQPRDNPAVGSPYTANNWLLDNGATHHIISDLTNLFLHQPYHGGYDVMKADGSNLQITHTGSLSLPSHSRDLKLHKVLCVPHINKNLISVYRLCNTNKVSVELFPIFSG